MPQHTRSTVLLCGLIGLLSGSARAAEVTPASVFKRDVQPLLAQFCYRCHNDKKHSAGLKLHQLDSDLINGKDGETWHDVLTKLNLGEMPPRTAKQPSEAQRQKIVDWLTTEIKRAAAAKRSTGGRVVLRRMTRYEYANTMRDLLGVNLDFAADLPPESVSPDGFQNNGSTLAISPIQLEFYLKIARRGLQKAIVTGEKPTVYTHHAEKSVKQRRRKKMPPASNRLVPGGEFLARMKTFPREGAFVIRVKAGAHIPPGQGYPRLSAAVGVRADVRSPKKTVSTVDIDAPLNAPRVYEFHGRIENFPLPSKNPKYPGMVITLTHDSQDLPAGNKRRRKKKTKVKAPPRFDPKQPLIAIEWVDFTGPVFDSWPPTSHQEILFPSKSSRNEKVYAREVLARFMRRAFRRPIAESEVDRMMVLFGKIRPRAASFELAMRDVLAMVLISPDFLYLLEPPERAGGKGKTEPLTDHELATRLSYFLWSTMPDAQLTRLADQGKLRDPKVLEKQVRTMIANRRSWNFVQHFTNQWLDLTGLERVAVNPEFYPGFDDRLKKDMRLETQHFFAEILKKDLSALNVLDSEFAMLIAHWRSIMG